MLHLQSYNVTRYETYKKNRPKDEMPDLSEKGTMANFIISMFVAVSLEAVSIKYFFSISGGNIIADTFTTTWKKLKLS